MGGREVPRGEEWRTATRVGGGGERGWRSAENIVREQGFLSMGNGRRGGGKGEERLRVRKKRGWALTSATRTLPRFKRPFPSNKKRKEKAKVTGRLLVANVVTIRSWKITGVAGHRRKMKKKDDERPRQKKRRKYETRVCEGHFSLIDHLQAVGLKLAAGDNLRDARIRHDAVRVGRRVVGEPGRHLARHKAHPLPRPILRHRQRLVRRAVRQPVHGALLHHRPAFLGQELPQVPHVAVRADHGVDQAFVFRLQDLAVPPLARPLDVRCHVDSTLHVPEREAPVVVVVVALGAPQPAHLQAARTLCVESGAAVVLTLLHEAFVDGEVADLASIEGQ
eukprot:Rhum_TRINITY_DN14452_c10_g1::Rhum_TRINITY_DN14452_c10_g1_i3::g.92495::m.92495